MRFRLNALKDTFYLRFNGFDIGYWIGGFRDKKSKLNIKKFKIADPI